MYQFDNDALIVGCRLVIKFFTNQI